VVAVLVVGGLIAFLLLRHRRARHSWEEQLSAALHDVGWFARDLIPQLRRTGSAAGVVAGWSVAAPRVAELEDELSRLVTTAPDEEHRTRAASVRDAVRDSRSKMVALAGEAGSDWEAGLDEVQAPLLAAIAPPQDAQPGV
jgi:hypothetical protein